MIAKWWNNLMNKEIDPDGYVAFCLWFIPFLTPFILFFAFLEYDSIETKKINDACLVQLKNGATSCPNVRGSSATYLTKKQRRLKRLGRPY